MLVPLTKVQIIGHRSLLERTVELLHRLRVVHLLDAAGDPELGLRSCAEEVAGHDRLRYLRARLEGVLSLLPPDDRPVAPASAPPDLDALSQELETVAPEAERLSRALEALHDEQANLPRHLGSVRRLLPLVGELVQLQRYEVVALLFERGHAGVLEALRAALVELVGPRCEVIAAPVDAGTVGALLVFPSDEAERVHALVSRQPVSLVRLPPDYRGLGLRQAVLAMEARLSELPGQIAAREAELHRLAGERLPAWRTASAWLELRLAPLRALPRLASTGHAFLLRGWVPRPELTRLEGALRALGPQIHLEELSVTPEERERAPVLLANPAPIQPFELLTRAFSLPRPGTVDPTPLLAAGVPLFFGMMLGDVGYGLLLLGGLLLLRRRLEPGGVARRLTSILLPGALSAIAFGVLFGELLGGLGHALGMRPLLLDRERAVIPFLLLAVGVGAAHVSLAWALGFYLSWRERRHGELLERGGTLLVLCGLFLLAGLAARRVPGAGLPPALAALLVGTLLLGAGGLARALTAPLEVLRVGGSVLSYVRIAALGLASVYLAKVANAMGELGPAWLGAALGALMHALNLALGTFSPSIQALRLHYVEFFAGFYREGGTEFEPFGAELPDMAAPTEPLAIG